MATVEFEEARRCPRCDNPGEQKSVRPAADRSKLYIFTCQNGACVWFETDWVVQKLEDGTVPVREASRQKTFPQVPGMTQEKAQRQLEETIKDEERGLRGR